MDERERVDVLKKTLTVFTSLQMAINSSGGFISPIELLNMTIEDFICKIAAPNYIKFVYGGKEDEGEE